MTESPEIKSHVYGQLIFDKGSMSIQQGKDSLFINGCRKTEQPHAEE